MFFTLLLLIIAGLIIFVKYPAIKRWANARKSWQQTTQESMNKVRLSWSARQEVAELDSWFAMEAVKPSERNVRR